MTGTSHPPGPTVKDMVESGIPLTAAVEAHLARAGLTKADWAHIVGVPARQVYRLLSGGERRKYDAVRNAMAKSFGVSREWLDGRLELEAGLGEE